MIPVGCYLEPLANQQLDKLLIVASQAVWEGKLVLAKADEAVTGTLHVLIW